MIHIQNLKKSFQQNTVLDGIDFTVEKGDVVAIIGPSGTGKSTLLRCINLLESPEEGTISFDDFSFDYGKHEKKEISSLRKRSTMVFQSFNLFQRKTVLQTHLGITAVGAAGSAS